MLSRILFIKVMRRTITTRLHIISTTTMRTMPLLIMHMFTIPLNTIKHLHTHMHLPMHTLHLVCFLAAHLSSLHAVIHIAEVVVPNVSPLFPLLSLCTIIITKHLLLYIITVTRRLLIIRIRTCIIRKHMQITIIIRMNLRSHLDSLVLELHRTSITCLISDPASTKATPLEISSIVYQVFMLYHSYEAPATVLKSHSLVSHRLVSPYTPFIPSCT